MLPRDACRLPTRDAPYRCTHPAYDIVWYCTPEFGTSLLPTPWLLLRYHKGYPNVHEIKHLTPNLNHHPTVCCRMARPSTIGQRVDEAVRLRLHAEELELDDFGIISQELIHVGKQGNKFWGACFDCNRCSHPLRDRAGMTQQGQASEVWTG